MHKDKSISHKQFTQANTKDNCLIAIDGIVYDVTTFLNDHPGGQLVLLQKGGQDATSDFNLIDHSENALRIREKYRIGKLYADTPIGDFKNTTSKRVEREIDRYQEKEPEGFWGRNTATILVVASLAIAALSLGQKLASRFSSL